MSDRLDQYHAPRGPGQKRPASPFPSSFTYDDMFYSIVSVSPDYFNSSLPEALVNCVANSSNQIEVREM